MGRYGTLADQIDNKAAVLTTAAGRLQNAATAVDRQNSGLLTELRQWDRWILPCAALVLLLVGAWAGYSWEQHQVTNALLNLQAREQQTQDMIKALPTASAPPHPG